MYDHIVDRAREKRTPVALQSLPHVNFERSTLYA